MSEQQSGAAELAALFPSERETRVGGEAITVQPLTIRQLGKVAAVLKRIADSASEFDIPSLVASHTEDVIEAVAAATDRPVEQIAGLRSDAFLALALDVFEVNADFFARHVVPLMERVKGATSALGSGPTSSPNSTRPASPTPAA
jgi:hypothetical protein